ncbi:MAG TPA: tetratricopeptide repeat protein [Flavobacteriales bacterium]|nr:tetratricopeptide repeat protein [Flavobacteriales bacterium]
MKITRVATQLFFATVLGVTFTSCGETEAAEQKDQVVVTRFVFPELKARQGEMAKTEEWEKTKTKVTELMAKLNRNDKDEKAILQLVQIYMQEARVTGEHPYYYPAILKILDYDLSLNKKSFEALTYKSSVLMSQHRFKEAHETATQAKSLGKGNAYIYGVLTDANVELGKYEEAVVQCDSMQLLKPSLESYARASYLREIYGDYKGSIEAMKLAVEAGLPASEPYCWCRKTLGVLFESTGRWKDAENEYLNILAARPDYAFAMEGLARVEKAREHYDIAIEWLNKAIAIMPEFSFHEELAEIMLLQGKKEEAMAKYTETTKMLEEDKASGHVVNLDIANVYASLGEYEKALGFVKMELEVRPQNIDVNSVAAWIYYKQGNKEKALEHIRIAKRTNSQQPVLNARAGIIESAMGDAKKGKTYLNAANKVNPQLVKLLEQKEA